MFDGRLLIGARQPHRVGARDDRDVLDLGEGVQAGRRLGGRVWIGGLALQHGRVEGPTFDALGCGQVAAGRRGDQGLEQRVGVARRSGIRRVEPDQAEVVGRVDGREHRADPAWVFRVHLQAGVDIGPFVPLHGHRERDVARVARRDRIEPCRAVGLHQALAALGVAVDYPDRGGDGGVAHGVDRVGRAGGEELDGGAGPDPDQLSAAGDVLAALEGDADTDLLTCVTGPAGPPGRRRVRPVSDRE